MKNKMKKNSILLGASILCSMIFSSCYDGWLQDFDRGYEYGKSLYSEELQPDSPAIDTTNTTTSLAEYSE